MLFVCPQHAWLDARHCAHARVEDRIRTGKDTGLGRFPSKLFAINNAWLASALTAIDLLAWTQTILLHDNPALPRPNQDAALPAAARRRQPRARPTTTPPQHRPNLALGERPGRRLQPATYTADTADLHQHPNLSTGHRQPGTRTRAITHARTRPRHTGDQLTARRSLRWAT